jgi:hypothetical protein
VLWQAAAVLILAVCHSLTRTHATPQLHRHTAREEEQETE